MSVELSDCGAIIKEAYEGEANTNAFTDVLVTKLASIEAGATADQSASEILVAIKTVDGPSSGLDADTLDGSELTAVLDRTNHTGTQLLSTISDAGDLAAKDTVAQSDIDAGAVGATQINDNTLSAMTQEPSPALTGLFWYERSGGGKRYITGAQLQSLVGGLVTSLSSGTTQTVDDTFTGLHKELTSGSSITITLQKTASVGTRCGFTPAGAGVVTVGVQSGAGYWVPLDDISGTARTASFTLLGFGYFEVIRNTGGSAAEWAFIGNGNIDSVVTASGTLTLAGHHGKLIVTSGHVTVPQIVGFACTVKAGGAHHITFNSTSTANATTGDYATVFVQTTTVVNISPWTTPQTLS